MHLIITLDGPAGVGKSTLARRLAQELKIPYLDTGAMFRMVALCMGEQALNLPESALGERLEMLEFSLEGSGDSSQVFCNGKASGPEIRNEKIALLSSRFATLPVVRSYLKKAQQDLGRQSPLVTEGRDMGTEIFTIAPCKFFLDASPSVRAMRRKLQLDEQGQDEDVSVLEMQIRERDKLDRERVVAPLRPAADALIVDTSNVDADGVFAILIGHVNKYLAES